MIDIRDVIAQALVLEDGSITHCERPVEWELHGHAECYAWVCTKCQVMSDYDCEEKS